MTTLVRAAIPLLRRDFVMSSSEDEAKTQGDLLRDKGDFDGAIAAYTEAIRLDPHSAEGYSVRGIAYGLKGDSDRAIADCTEAIRIDAKFFEAFRVRAKAHDMKGEFDEAIADYTEAIRINPQFAEAY